MSKRKSNMSAGIGHHAARQRVDSSTTKESRAQEGYLICKGCLASHHDKHWYTQDETLRRGLPQDAIEALCPGCYRIENNIWEGTVEIGGDLDINTRKSIEAMIANVETDCWKDNPASRILKTSEENSKVVIKTTTVWLAKRIGKELEKTFKGNLEMKDSPEKETVFIRWYKD